jgi:LacI family transcriptional regulator, sucrose operon repressor
MVTINDIATRAGVSRTTVSRVINQSGYVSEKAREKIRLVIEETGYVPSEHAKSLRLQRTKVVGVILPKISTETTSRIVGGIDKELSGEGYQILLANSNLEMAKEIEHLKLLESRRVDGIILIATNTEPELLETIDSLSVPIVAVGQDIPGISSVVYDDYRAAAMLTEEIIKKGHTRIAFIGVEKSDYAVGVVRKKAFLETMEKYHLPVKDEWVQTATFSIAAGEEAAEAILKTDPEVPTAIFAVTDRLAVGAMQTLRRKNYRLPEDMAIVGMGASDMSAYITPALTTVDYHYEAAGREASRMLLQNLKKGEKKVEKSRMRYRLLERNSLL